MSVTQIPSKKLQKVLHFVEEFSCFHSQMTSLIKRKINQIGISREWGADSSFTPSQFG